MVVEVTGGGAAVVVAFVGTGVVCSVGLGVSLPPRPRIPLPNKEAAACELATKDSKATANHSSTRIF